jgi:hypothetical protein
MKAFIYAAGWGAARCVFEKFFESISKKLANFFEFISGDSRQL